MSATAFSSNESTVLERVAEVEGEVVKTPSELLDPKYDLEMCAKWVRDHVLEKVCLQFPDNLLPDSLQIALRLEKRLNRKLYILGDTSYGSCCIDEVTAQHVGADGILHFGHACLNPTSRLPVFHVLDKEYIDVETFCSEFKRYFKDRERKILFFYDSAYAHAIESIYSNLKPSYRNLTLTKLNCVSNVNFTDSGSNSNSFVLGRRYSLENGYVTQDYEAVFLGPNGKTLSNFAMGIPSKNWHYFDGGCMREFTVFNSPWLKRRRFLVEKLKDARIVGIVVATLGIKNYLESIATIKQTLKAKNKKSYILSVGKPNPAKLANFPEIDVFVVIACPENTLYDCRDFYKPILTPFEVELAFNSARQFSTQFCMDFRQILPGGVEYVPFESSSDSDVSLLSGGIRNLTNDEPLTNEMGALVSKSAGTVAVGKEGASYLQARTWQGLDQRLGQDCAKPAEKGRSGLPIGYENEPVSKDT